MVCIEKSDVHKIVEEHLSKYQTSLEKNLSLQFEITNGKIEQVIEKVDRINGRVGRTEGQVRELQDLRLSRTLDCPYRPDIEVLRKKFIEEIGIEAYIQEAEEKREKLETKRNRVLLTTIALVTLLLGGLTFLFNYFF